MSSNLQRITWQQFRDSGLFWFINTILHTFGLVIVMEIKDNGETEVYPAKTKWRGFSGEDNHNGYMKVTKYMMENADRLYKDVTR